MEFADLTGTFGARFVLRLVPLLAVELIVCAVLWSGAPQHRPSWKHAAETVASISGWSGAYLLLAALILAVVLQPLQLGLVRLLEGYWGDSRTAHAAARLVGAPHRRRRRRLTEAQELRGSANATGVQLARMTLAKDRLRRYPEPDRMMPTVLGNVLRAAEDRAGQRYGLNTIVTWPRLYPLLPPAFSAALADLRDQLDLAARTCATASIGAVATAVLLAPYDVWLLVPVAMLVVAELSYRAAVAAAWQYGEAIQVAFDLYRFELFTALHLALPTTEASERALTEKINRKLAGDVDETLSLPYVKPPDKDKPGQ